MEFWKCDISIKAVNNIFSSNHIQYQNNIMFNKVYGVNVQSPIVFRENGKLWNLHFRPKFSKTWFHQIAHIKYWIINDLTNEISVMVWYKRKFEITVVFLRRRPSTFWKTVEKKWWDFILKKVTTVRISNQVHQKSVEKCSFQMFDRKIVNLS